MCESIFLGEGSCTIPIPGGHGVWGNQMAVLLVFGHHGHRLGQCIGYPSGAENGEVDPHALLLSLLSFAVQSTHP